MLKLSQITESVWSDIQNRSTGDQIRKEDDIKIKWNEMDYTLQQAVKSFLEKSKLDESDIRVTVEDKSKKAIIRIMVGNAEEIMNQAKETIYHGWRYDIFEFIPKTEDTGILRWDSGLTYDYRDKCRD